MRRSSLGTNSVDLVVFDNVVGRNVVIPAASRITAGDRFRVVGPTGTTTITFVAGAPVNPGDVQFNGTETADQLALAVIAALPTTLRPVNLGGGVINMLAASTLIFDDDSPIAQSNPTRVVQNADQLVVPDGFSISTGDEFTVVGASTSTRFVFVQALTGAPDELLYSITETASQIGAKILARLPAVLDPDPRARWFDQLHQFTGHDHLCWPYGGQRIVTARPTRQSHRNRRPRR